MAVLNCGWRDQVFAAGLDGEKRSMVTGQRWMWWATMQSSCALRLVAA
jgi:hypothetical protein